MSNVRKNTVLIVDDEQLVIQALTRILGDEYTIYVVKDGQDAIVKAEQLQPEVILLDIVMPGMDGYDVITALKSSEKTCNIPVIFISGLYDVDAEEKGLALGASDYIIKPFSPEVVRLRVRNQIMMINQMRLIIEKELVERSYHAKMEFLSCLSHEMLTPMNAVIGMTQIAKAEDNSPKTKECLTEISTSSQHLLKLIHDLLGIQN